jgi:hypothetical protein
MIFEKTDHITDIVDFLACPPRGLFGCLQLQQNQIGHRRKLE